MTGDGHRAGSNGVMVLAVAAACAHQKPAFLLDELDSFTNLHTSSGLLDTPSAERVNHALQHQSPISAAQDRLAGALRMRHRAGHVPLLVADAGDAVEGAVRVGGFRG